MSPRILVADDEINSREILYRLLHTHGEIIEAATGRQALDMVQAEHFDLVLLDSLMPGLTGMEVLKMMRVLPNTADVPVIFLSELAPDHITTRDLPISDADFLLKPLDIDVLLARVETHLAD